MGKHKTKRSVDTKNMKRAHKLAEAFAVYKTDTMLDNFLMATDLAVAMYSSYIEVQERYHKEANEIRVSLEPGGLNDLNRQDLENKLAELEADIDSPRQSFEEYKKKVKDDLNLQFGGALALAYAMGHIDSSSGASTRDLAVDTAKADMRTGIDKLKILNDEFMPETIPFENPPDRAEALAKLPPDLSMVADSSHKIITELPVGKPPTGKIMV